MNYDIEIEGAGGMSHDQAAAVLFKIEKMNIDPRTIKTLIFNQREGWVGVVFKDGKEAVIPELIDIPGGRKVFLPGMH
jgi:hypothetical protein